MVDPAKRIFINDLVCEGCGDCSEKSNCLSVIPKETEFGRKRQIDQSACNKDYSCVNGFCPSFVAIVGGELNKSPKIDVDLPLEDIPRPKTAKMQQGVTYNILVTGVGGTGVITIGALIGMAAHLEGKGFAIHDSIGMAQKFGGVSSHVRIAPSVGEIHAVQIPCASVDVLLGGDLPVTALPKILSLVNPTKTQILINTNQTVTGEFIQNLNFDFKNSELTKRICDSVETDVESMPATDIAVALTGDAIGANLFLLGYACQKGWLPVSLESLELAIDINGIAVKNNKYALALGRYGTVDMTGLLAAISTDENAENDIAVPLDDIVAKREKFLINYQDKDYAVQYLNLVDQARIADVKLTQKAGAFTEAVARYYFKLMAYKDEYEVARLYTDPRFIAQIKQKFTGKYKLKLYMAPPLISQRDTDTGEFKKREFGAWVLVLFKLLTKLKGLRGTVFDIFGYTFERRQERELIKEYSILVENIINDLSAKNYEKAVELASLPDQMRGFGHVKERAIEIAKTREKELLSEFYSSDGPGIPTVANYVSYM